MKSRRQLAPTATLIVMIFLAGCVSPTLPRMQRTLPVADTTASTESPTTSATGNGQTDIETTRTAAKITAGSGEMINQGVASEAPPVSTAAGEATFNFEGESLHAVVKAILGDLLQQNYVIAPGVQGTVTLATPQPVSAAQALSLLEMVLGWNNARLIWTDGRYNVLPSDQAIAGNLSPRAGSPADARGYEVRAVALKFISASEMEKLLKPYARDRAIVQVDSARNLIVLAGTRNELQNYLRTVEIFDVDWLAGMSVGVYTLQSTEASKMVSALEKVFGDDAKSPLAGMFRFMPLEGQNAVMVVSTQARYLTEIESWIERMDAGGDGVRLYVYEVKFMKAAEIASQLGAVFGNASGSNSASAAPSLMPGLEPVQVNTDSNTQTVSPVANPAPAQSGNSSTTLKIGGEEVGVSAVGESNSLLVRASPANWESIRRAVDRLDIMPLQVHIEAQVVEVKLTGELSYGVSWFFGNAIDAATKATTDTLTSWQNSGTSIKPAPNGSSFTFLGPSAQAVINTLDSVTELHVLSAPSVLVRNNVEADFNSGTQIPVASTIINSNGGTNTDNSFSQVQFRQTGISLKVRPRVSSNGMVFLDITQDVSSPSPTGPTIGGNISVDNRKLHTEVAVQSGETVMLAGLIKTEQGKGSNGIPYLSRIPVIGGLFGAQNKTNNRDEVLVLITPTVVRDPSEARKLTDEYSSRFRAMDPLRKSELKSARKAESKAETKSAPEQ